MINRSLLLQPFNLSEGTNGVRREEEFLKHNILRNLIYCNGRGVDNPRRNSLLHSIVTRDKLSNLL
jgi:hypothetical protein